ncbi:MAG TPA: hypothetical protein VFT84_04305, partial [Gemmatimonadales bacterium]|nr:hypothetical protein [Gemmatimonadales bacterium]
MSANVLEALTALDLLLLALGFLLALLLSHAGLAIAGRLADARGASRWIWLSIGAVAIGAGLWALGIATLLPLPPSGPTRFGLRTGGLAFGIGIAGAALTLAAFSLARPRWLRWSAGAAALAVTVTLELYLCLSALGWADALTRDPALAGQVLAASLAGAALLLGAGLMVIEARPRRRAWEAAAAIVGA